MNNQHWHNRIVGEGAEAPDQLLANPFNARIHPQYQQDALVGVLDSVGWVDRIIVNRTTGHVVDGHLRVMLALKRDEPLVPVQYVELTEDEEKLVLSTFDPITGLAAYDREKLDELLREVNSDSPAIQQMLAELAADNNLYLNGDEPPTDPGAQVDKAAELQQKWQVKRGDLWQIGKHRLLCGDSTNAEDVARVMAEERVAIAMTSPPYPGVNMWRDMWPNMSIQECHEWLGNVWHFCIDYCKTLIVNIADTIDNEMNDYYCIQAAQKSGWRVARRAIWHKTGFVPAGISDNLALVHEFVIWLTRDEPWTNREWVRSSGEHGLISTVFSHPFELDRTHKAPYPVSLCTDWIKVWSEMGDTILDPFLGSGTTLVACEQLGRQGRGIEISPEYCSVILERMSGLGLSPERV